MKNNLPYVRSYIYYISKEAYEKLMPLSAEVRGVLELQIENYLSLIPQYVTIFRDKQSKLILKEPNDAVFGYVLGSIIASFAPTLTNLAFANKLTPDIMVEVSEIVFRRSAEIRNRIIDTG
jgi:hypothetical protein